MARMPSTSIRGASSLNRRAVSCTSVSATAPARPLPSAFSIDRVPPACERSCGRKFKQRMLRNYLARARRSAVGVGRRVVPDRAVHLPRAVGLTLQNPQNLVDGVHDLRAFFARAHGAADVAPLE